MSSKNTVGIISDTHGYFDPQIPGIFAEVEHILHAGDVGNPQIIHKLQEIAPVVAVAGNVDVGVHSLNLGSQLIVDLFGIRIWMVHILGDPHHSSPALRCEISRLQPRVVVFGHSHQPFLEEIDSILFFNPGSAGPPRFSLPRCLGLLDIEDGRVRGRIVDL